MSQALSLHPALGDDAAAAQSAARASETLETERLRLRPLTLEDAGWISRESSRPEVARMIARVPLPNPPLFAEMFVLIARASEAARGDCVRAIEDRKSAAPLGVIGLHPHQNGWEFGYWLARDAWGRGYATEAGRAMVAEADRLGRGPLTAGHFSDNPASCRVLEKLGFAYTGEVRETFSVGRMAKADNRVMARA